MEVIDEVADVLKMDCDVITLASLRAFLEKESRYRGGDVFEIGQSVRMRAEYRS